MNNKYTVEYFYNKFNKIPDEKWAMGQFVNHDDKTICCALGHCGNRNSKATVQGTTLIELVESNFRHLSIAHINDGYNTDNTFYPQELGDTPKERVLNALVLIGSGILEEVE